ncbi:MAG: tetratricopeptide repeat protein [Thermoguttaceae bacterium]|nr:tetratricopeptide repeat protein [Thermoguttaceae bacterium]
MRQTFLLRIFFFIAGAGLFFLPARGGEPDSPAGAARWTEGVEAFFQGDSEAAYRHFTAAQEENPSFPPAGVALALLAKQRGDLSETHAFLKRAIDENPGDPEPWYRLAEIAAEENRLVELELLRGKADALLAAFCESGSWKDSPRLPFLRGESISVASRALECAGDLPAAESKMREYIGLNPDGAEGYLSLGYLLFRQEKNDEALEAFARAKERNPSLFAGWLTLASLLEEKGDIEGAGRLFDAHLNDGTLAPHELSRVARFLFRRGRLDETREMAARMTPGSLEQIKWDALLAYSEGDFKTAESGYRKALRMAPNDFDLIGGLTLALAEQEESASLTEAFERADRFRRRNPSSDEAAVTLAWVEFRRGNAERAEDILLPILDRGGLTPTSAFYLASVAASRRQDDLARQLLTSALADTSFFPKRRDAEKLLESLTRNSETSETAKE